MGFSVTFKKAFFKLIPYKWVRVFLKKVNLNYLFFGKAITTAGTYLLKDTDTTFKTYGMEAELPAAVLKGFKERYIDYTNHKGLLCEYVLQVDNCIIEPVYGWGITANNKLILDSIANNRWIETYHPDFFLYKKNKNNAVHYPSIISLRLIKGGESNYWHFLHDLLGQLALAKSEGIEAPVLISKVFSEKAFFKMALQKSKQLSAITWVIQDEQYIKADKAYFLQTKPNDMKQFFGVLKLLEITDGDKLANRHIFLTRNKNRIRFIENAEEIEAIAVKYNFEIVDTDKISFLDQIKLFSSTSHLIGIHGAGLTNVMFRLNAPLTVLELLPGDYIEPHYFWLSKGMGHKYFCQLGSKSHIDTSFSINATQFENKIKQMLA
jgi:Glycosyltransferase 61